MPKDVGAPQAQVAMVAAKTRTIPVGWCVQMESQVRAAEAVPYREPLTSSELWAWSTGYTFGKDLMGTWKRAPFRIALLVSVSHTILLLVVSAATLLTGFDPEFWRDPLLLFDYVDFPAGWFAFPVIWYLEYEGYINSSLIPLCRMCYFALIGGFQWFIVSYTIALWFQRIKGTSQRH